MNDYFGTFCGRTKQPFHEMSGHLAFSSGDDVAVFLIGRVRGGKPEYANLLPSCAAKKDILVPGYRLPGTSVCLYVCLKVYVCVP